MNDEELFQILEKMKKLCNDIEKNCYLLEEQDKKYRWHDLLKDPTDLPTERDWYLAIFRESATNFVLVPRVADYVGKPTPITTKGNWLLIDIYNENMCDYYRDLECIAWKRIEKFGGKK